MGRRVEVVWPEALVDGIDAVLDGRSRSVWLRRLVERELGVASESRSVRSDPGAKDSESRAVAPSPDPQFVEPPVLSEAQKAFLGKQGVVKASSLKVCPECGSAGRVHQRGCSKA